MFGGYGFGYAQHASIDLKRTSILQYLYLRAIFMTVEIELPENVRFR